MRYTTIIGTSTRLGLLLLTAAAVGPVGAQNQTPANVAPPAWLTAAWKDPNTGLMWTLRGNCCDINQTDALNYCRDLSLGGFRGWRLPEIDELAGIWDPSVVSGIYSHSGFDDVEVHVKGGIQINGYEAWSALHQDISASIATRANRATSRTPSPVWAGDLFFDFSDGTRKSPRAGYYVWTLRVLCVRRAGE